MATTDAARAPATPPTGLGVAAARGAGITIAAQAVRFLLQIGSLVVLTRLLTPQDFGVVAMVTAITGVAAILRDFGLSAIQARTLRDDERSNLFWINVAIGLGCGGLVAACAPLIDDLYGRRGLTHIVLALAVVFVISGVNTQFGAELARELRFKALAFADISAQACGITFAVALARLGAGYWAIVAQQIIVAILTLTFNVRCCHWRPGPYRRGVKVGRFFKFSGGVLGVQLISYLTMNIDNVVVGIYSGATALGLYSRAYQLLMTPLNQINAPLTRVVLPVLSRVQDDDTVYERYLHRAQLVACYLTATVFTVCVGLAYPLTHVLFGPRWGGVAPLFALLAIGGVFRSIAQISYWVYLSRNRTLAQLRLYLVIRPIMIGIIVGGVAWGPKGVALACTVAYFGYWAASLWHVSRNANVSGRALLRTAVRAVLVVSAPCGVLAWSATLLVSTPVLQVVLGLALASAGLGGAVLLSSAVREDAQFLAGLVMRGIGGSSVSLRTIGRGVSMRRKPVEANCSKPA